MAQVGIAIGALGAVLALMGMFPGVAGLGLTPGIGLFQVMFIVTGFTLLISGALLYAQGTFYPGIKHNLAQQIAVRLSATGLLFAAIAGLGDLLGFGSHPPGVTEGPILGYWQAAGLIGGFLVASFGVMLFALLGPPAGTPPGTPPDGKGQ